MNNSPELLLELVEACEKKSANLDKTATPVLKESFQLFQANYRSFYELLLQKGLVKPDPYKNDRHLSDIKMPEEVPQVESEVEDRLLIILSEFDNLLDFLISFTPLDCKSLNLKKIKILTAIIKYIEWTKLIPTNSHMLSRCLGILAEKIKGGDDDISAGNLQSIQTRMDGLSKDIMKALKAVTDFKREEYKIQVRQKLVPQIPAFQHPVSRDDFVRHVKAAFPKFMGGEAFYPELLQELHLEIYEANLETLKPQILERLRVEEPKKKTDTSHKFNLRDILNEALKNLGTSSRYLDESVAKLQDNQEIIKTRPKTLMEKIKAWIISLSQPKEKDQTMELELIDMYTSAKKIERIQFNAYCVTVQRKARYLASFMVKNSATYVKLETSTDDQLYDLLERNMLELKVVHDTLDAMDTYFKTESPVSERQKLKGIKVELAAIKNSIGAVSQKMHEYIARKDEMEQLKKLGIQVQS